MLTAMKDCLTSKEKSKDWDLKKGPAPGVKYRGGMPPQPPTWSYAKDDLRAYQKWERRIRIWQEHVSAYLPPNEASMLLYCSLRGECEEELEWAPLEKINSNDGVDYILETLKKPLMTRTIYLKRRFLHEFEQVARTNGESIRAFCNRYGRVERSLHSVGIDITTVYDREARGSRLLDRMRLSLDQQRLILTSTGQDLDYDKVKEASQLQFPEHRPVPPVVFAREFEREREAGSKGTSSSASFTTSFKSSSKGKTKGKAKGKDGYSGKGPGPSYTRSTERSRGWNSRRADQLHSSESFA